MKTIIALLYHISLLAGIITHVTAAPAIAHPPLTLTLVNGDETRNLSLSTHYNNNATAHPTLSYISPPETPFNLYIPNTNIILRVDYTRYIPDRIEHWVHEALKRAYDQVRRHPRSQLIAYWLPRPYIVWPGDPDRRARESTDIELRPGRDLTWGMFTDFLAVMLQFVLDYPEWDFGFEIEREGVYGNVGECSFTTRHG